MSVSVFDQIKTCQWLDPAKTELLKKEIDRGKAKKLIDSGVTVSKQEYISGVYFLIKDNVIVYIGQSINCKGRILEHIREGNKKFDFAKIVRCDINDLAEMERLFLDYYLPKYNTDGLTRKLKRKYWEAAELINVNIAIDTKCPA